MHLSGKKDSLARGWKVMYLDYAVERTLTNTAAPEKKNWIHHQLKQKIRTYPSVFFLLLFLLNDLNMNSRAYAMILPFHQEFGS